MNFLFISVYTIWFLTELVLNRLLRVKSTDKQRADKNSLVLIWMTIVTAVFCAVFISNHFYFPITLHPAIRYIGLALILIGVMLRLIAVISLGKFFTVAVTIRQGHQLKKDGLYKYLRHPSYAASLLSFIGLGLALNNWLSLALIVVAALVVFSVRMAIEEKVLMEQFGAAYLDYKKQTKRLIPFIY